MNCWLYFIYEKDLENFSKLLGRTKMSYWISDMGEHFWPTCRWHWAHTVLSCTSLHRVQQDLVEPKNKFTCSVCTWPDWLHQNEWPWFEATSPGLMPKYGFFFTVFWDSRETINTPGFWTLCFLPLFGWLRVWVGVRRESVGGAMLFLYCRIIDSFNTVL